MGFRVFKTTFTNHKGKRQEAASWFVEFKDHNQSVRRLTGFTSKAASEEMGRGLVKLVEFHVASGGQIDPALSRWLTTLPQRVREKLVAIGLLAAERVAVSKHLMEHLADFGKALYAKGSSPFHVEVVTARARRIIDACKFRFFADISASKVMSYLHELRADKDDKRGISAQTFNFYLQAVKQFCKWMVKDRRVIESPVAYLNGLNVKTDRRRDRRAFQVDELRRLLETARDGPGRHGTTGYERSLLYWLAVETGLRSGELRSLTRSSFNLDGDGPAVTVSAGYSKRRREDTVPLRADLAQALRFFLATMAPATQAFRIPNDHKKAAQMFRADVEAAGIAYRDASGLVADFHSLRHTFISNLAASGVHPKTAQQLARHSTITLTMDRYTHSYRGDESEALALLPDLSQPSGQAARATGTEGKVEGPNAPARLALRLARQQGFQATSVDSDGLSPGSGVESQSLVIPAVSAEKQGFGSVCTSGGGPGLQNQWRV